MALIDNIVQYLKSRGEATPLKSLYDEFNDIAPTTIRGRIYDNLGKKVSKVAPGVYFVVENELQAIIEKADSTSEELYLCINRARLKYDLIFLDIPYRATGQKGGNRNLSDFDYIGPTQFAELLERCNDILRTEISQVYFMITGGKDSEKSAINYISSLNQDTLFNKNELKLAGEGKYYKLTSQGKVCNMGQYPLPPERIMVYSKSGKLRKCDEDFTLDFRLQRPPVPANGGYPTQKPLQMLRQIVKQSTNVGEWCLDLFAGSGVMLDACRELKRNCHLVDISDISINKFILPKLGYE